MLTRSVYLSVKGGGICGLLIYFDIFLSFYPCFPGSGSDAASLSTTAQLHGDHYVLNGSKVCLPPQRRLVETLPRLETWWRQASPARRGGRPHTLVSAGLHQRRRGHRRVRGDVPDGRQRTQRHLLPGGGEGDSRHGLWQERDEGVCVGVH